MVCEKCGAQLGEEFEICPKCGNKIKKKIGWKKILVITLLVALIGAALFLYMSGYYKNIMMQFVGEDEENTAATINDEDGNTVVKTAQNGSTQEAMAESQENDDGVEKVQEEPDVLAQYLAGLTIEPVEMTIGETHLVELEQKIPNAVWRSSDENVVLVEDGQLKALMPGNAIITLSTDVKDSSFDVTVNDFQDLTLAVNCSNTIEINNAISDVRWESSVPEIVSVEDGVITSLASGASDITVFIGGNPYTFEVVATTPEITTTSVRKIIGNTEQISILGTNGKAEWKSDNTAIATVSDTGLITAEPTGAGQSTVVHAYIDGMEFEIDVAVEPIPQLSSTYKIYGHQDNYDYKNAQITICTNANETATVTYPPENRHTYMTFGDGTVGTGYAPKINTMNVLNVADADYSDGMTFPVYYAFCGAYQTAGSTLDTANHSDIYLVGTSQIANVKIQSISCRKEEADGIGLGSQSRSVVTYESCENYGIIHIYHAYNTELVTVTVDGYQYQFIIRDFDGMTRLNYANIDRLDPNYMIDECSVDEIIVHEKINVNYSELEANSRTYFGGDEWVERIGTKFVEAVEDEAISMAAGFLLKAIFL